MEDSKLNIEKYLEQLELTRDTYEGIFHALTEAIYIIDENLRFIEVNRGAEKMYGYTRDEFLALGPRDVAAPGLNDEQFILNLYHEVMTHGTPRTTEFWAVRKNGEIFPKEIILNRGKYFGKDCLIVVARDITEHKRSEKKRTILYNIARSVHLAATTAEMFEIIRSELNQLFDTTNFFVALYNPEKDTLRQLVFHDEKDSFEEWSASETLSGMVVKSGRTVHLIGEEIDAFALQHNLKKIGTNPACWLGVPIYIQNKPAGAMVIQHYTNPYAYNPEDVSLLEMIAHETGIYIEKQKMIEDLIQAKHKAEESDRLKTAFLQNLSHEIRTPLNGIIGFADLLQQPDITKEERQQFAKIIVDRGQQLSSIINDIITVSSLETRQEHINPEPFHIVSLLKDLVLQFENQAREKGLTLTLHNKLPEQKALIISDKAKIGQIFNNLLTNAIKFTPEGHIEIGCELRGNFLQFYVKDTGIGIEHSKHQIIFDRFTQADEKIRREYGGTGLGLSICKGFVELLGGRIWVESSPGKGSTFYFTIPYKPSPDSKFTEKENSAITVPDHQICVLVAEDEDSNFLYLDVLLKKFNCRVLHAENGQQAVELCQKHPVNLVLMDIKMPVMDGYTAAGIIKKNHPDLPVIAQTAITDRDGNAQHQNAVFDDYLTKPFTREKIQSILHRFVFSS